MKALLCLNKEKEVDNYRRDWKHCVEWNYTAQMLGEYQLYFGNVWESISGHMMWYIPYTYKYIQFKVVMLNFKAEKWSWYASSFQKQTKNQFYPDYDVSKANLCSSNVSIIKIWNTHHLPKNNWWIIRSLKGIYYCWHIHITISLHVTWKAYLAKMMLW